MTHAAIALPASIRSIVDLLSDAVWRGRREIVARCGTPDEMRRSNARAFADLSRALAHVRRLKRVLRYMFIILAAWIDLPKTKIAAALAGPRRPPQTPPVDHAQPIHRPPRMTLSKPYRLHFVGAAPPPAVFRNAACDPVRLLARHIETLTHALLEPMPYIRRLARQMRRDTCFLAWRPPKRPPPEDRRQCWDELLNARDQAWWELRERRWLKRADSS